MKKRIAFITVLISLLLFLSSCASQEILFPELYIFESLDECDGLLDGVADAKIVKHETCEGDKKIKELKYDQCYAATASVEDCSFDLFAYIFNDEADAKSYFTNVTGKTTEPTTNFSISIGSGRYRVVVIDGRNAYAAYCTVDCAEQMLNFFESAFSKKLSFSASETT